MMCLICPNGGEFHVNEGPICQGCGAQFEATADELAAVKLLGDMGNFCCKTSDRFHPERGPDAEDVRRIIRAFDEARQRRGDR